MIMLLEGEDRVESNLICHLMTRLIYPDWSVLWAFAGHQGIPETFSTFEAIRVTTVPM